MLDNDRLVAGISRHYSGRILNGHYSKELQNDVRSRIIACRGFDEIGLGALTYIAAWRQGMPGIWYEYAGQRFLDLFKCTDTACLAEAFCRSIQDRRAYVYENVCPDITETTLKGPELDTRRPELRSDSVQAGVVQAVYKVRLPDDRTLWLKDWAKISTFQDDGVCLSPGYLTDITMEMEQKDQVSELNVMVNRDKGLLVEAERFAALGQISAKVFHEIRNPVSAIGGLAGRLLKKKVDPESLPFLEVIVKESERLETILGNLFSFTAPVELNREPTDPVELVKSVIGLLRSELDREKIVVTLNVRELLPALELDREQIHLALVHIVKNSMEAMFDGGVLEIEMIGDRDAVMITISDSGVGIRAVHEKRVTEPFFTTKVYGTGLGLSLAQKAIQLHRGTLEITRHESGGVCNVIRLPFS